MTGRPSSAWVAAMRRLCPQCASPRLEWVYGVGAASEAGWLAVLEVPEVPGLVPGDFWRCTRCGEVGCFMDDE